MEDTNVSLKILLCFDDGFQELLSVFLGIKLEV